MRTHRLATIVIVALLGAPRALCAQTAQNSWQNLMRFQPGHKIKIVDMDLKAWSGKLLSVSDGAITIQEKRTRQEITVEHAKVLRVTDLERSRRRRNVLIGFVAGVGVGSAWAARQSEDVGTVLPILPGG
jgi:hypothetical protein